MVGAVFLFGNFLRIDRSHLNPVPSIEEIRLEDFSYSPEDGYTFLPAPFGTPEDEMVSLFGYSISRNHNLLRRAPTFDLLGLPAKYDSELSPRAFCTASPFSPFEQQLLGGGDRGRLCRNPRGTLKRPSPADETERKENALGPFEDAYLAG